MATLANMIEKTKKIQDNHRIIIMSPVAIAIFKEILQAPDNVFNSHK